MYLSMYHNDNPVCSRKYLRAPLTGATKSAALPSLSPFPKGAYGKCCEHNEIPSRTRNMRGFQQLIETSFVLKERCGQTNSYIHIYACTWKLYLELLRLIIRCGAPTLVVLEGHRDREWCTHNFFCWDSINMKNVGIPLQTTIVHHMNGCRFGW